VGKKVARSIIQVNKGHLHVSSTSGDLCQDQKKYTDRLSSTAVEKFVSTSFGTREKEEVGLKNFIKGYSLCGNVLRCSPNSTWLTHPTVW
jgi:hypothetical protein